MSTRQLTLINQMNELTILRAFEQDEQCLTVAQLLNRNISPIRENVFRLIDQLASHGLIHYRDDKYEQNGERDYDCTVSLIKRSYDYHYPIELAEKISKAKLPAPERVCSELYSMYCDIMLAEIVHMAHDACDLAKLKIVKHNSFTPTSNVYINNSLRELTGFIATAAELYCSDSWDNQMDKLLALSWELMSLGKTYDFEYSGVNAIQASGYIQNQIFLNEYLYKGEWSLDKKLVLPLFRYREFGLRYC